MIQPNQMQTQIQPGRAPRTRQNLPAVDIENLRIDPNRRKPPGEQLGIPPMRRRFKPVKQPRRSQSESTRTDRHNPRTPLVAPPKRVNQSRRNITPNIRHSSDDKRVRRSKILKPILSSDAEPTDNRHRCPTLRAHLQVIPPRPQLRPRQPEHLDNTTKLERAYPSKRKYGNTRTRPPHNRTRRNK